MVLDDGARLEEQGAPLSAKRGGEVDVAENEGSGETARRVVVAARHEQGCGRAHVDLSSFAAGQPLGEFRDMDAAIVPASADAVDGADNRRSGLVMSPNHPFEPVGMGVDVGIGENEDLSRRPMYSLVARCVREQSRRRVPVFDVWKSRLNDLGCLLARAAVDDDCLEVLIGLSRESLETAPDCRVRLVRRDDDSNTRGRRSLRPLAD